MMPIWIVVPPIFKIRICESWLFEITTFHTQTVFISKAKLILNTKMLKWTLNLHETPCYWPICQNYCTIQCKFLWILKLRVRVFGKVSRIQFNKFYLAVFWYHLLIGWPIRYCKWIDIVLTTCQKIGKNTRGRLELWTSIYVHMN